MRVNLRLRTAMSKAHTAASCLQSGSFKTELRNIFGGHYNARAYKCRWAKHLLNGGSAATFCSGKLANLYAGSYVRNFYENAIGGSTNYQTAYMTIFQETGNLIAESHAELVNDAVPITDAEPNAVGASDVVVVSNNSSSSSGSGRAGPTTIAPSSSTNGGTTTGVTSNSSSNSQLVPTTSSSSTSTSTSTTLPPVIHAFEASVVLRLTVPSGTLCSKAFIVSQLDDALRDGLASYLLVSATQVAVTGGSCLVENSGVSATSRALQEKKQLDAMKRHLQDPANSAGIGFRAEMLFTVGGFYSMSAAETAADRVYLSETSEALLFLAAMDASFQQYGFGVTSVAHGSLQPRVFVEMGGHLLGLATSSSEDDSSSSPGAIVGIAFAILIGVSFAVLAGVFAFKDRLPERYRDRVAARQEAMKVRWAFLKAWMREEGEALRQTMRKVKTKVASSSLIQKLQQQGLGSSSSKTNKIGIHFHDGHGEELSSIAEADGKTASSAGQAGAAQTKTKYQTGSVPTGPDTEEGRYFKSLDEGQDTPSESAEGNDLSQQQYAAAYNYNLLPPEYAYYNYLYGYRGAGDAEGAGEQLYAITSGGGQGVDSTSNAAAQQNIMAAHQEYYQQLAAAAAGAGGENQSSSAIAVDQYNYQRNQEPEPAALTSSNLVQVEARYFPTALSVIDEETQSQIVQSPSVYTGTPMATTGSAAALFDNGGGLQFPASSGAATGVKMSSTPSPGHVDRQQSNGSSADAAAVGVTTNVAGGAASSSSSGRKPPLQQEQELPDPPTPTLPYSPTRAAFSRGGALGVPPPPKPPSQPPTKGSSTQSSAFTSPERARTSSADSPSAFYPAREVVVDERVDR
ncbi:unnamed protein product [Amoebophrya sp. A25]|nr:unnamed protein product [Amoebophrya sp. A25]|eukprot:GSA25T00012393001.1